MLNRTFVVQPLKANEQLLSNKQVNMRKKRVQLPPVCNCFCHKFLFLSLKETLWFRWTNHNIVEFYEIQASPFTGNSAVLRSDFQTNEIR